MKTISIMVLFVLLLTGCVTTITREGGTIRPITAEQKQKAEYLGIVTGSFSWGYSTAEDAESAMNEVRNKAAKLGGNAIYIVNIDSNPLNTTVVADVYRFNFNTK